MIIGAGGHARVVVEALSTRRVIGHVAPANARIAATVLGPRLGGDEAIDALAAAGHEFAVGVGFVDHEGAKRRARLLETLGGVALVAVVHPSSSVSVSAVVEPGAFVAAGAVVGVGARIGRSAIVNSGAVVDHDCRLAANVHVASGATLAGGVTVGQHSLVGAGAVVRQDITIGSGVVIGAGAVVIDNVPDGATAVGVPARLLSRAPTRQENGVRNTGGHG